MRNRGNTPSRLLLTCIFTGIGLVSFLHVCFAQPTQIQPLTAYSSEQVRVIEVISVPAESSPNPNECPPNAPTGLTLEGSTSASCPAVTKSQKFRAIYELGGQQYSVTLPFEPGEFLELQTPIPQIITSQSQSPPDDLISLPVTSSAAYGYPCILFLGLSYRPLPYLGGLSRSQRAFAGMRGFRRGRR